MQSNSIRGLFAGVVAGSIGIALVFANSAHSAEQTPVNAGDHVPAGYVLVNQAELRKLVHDEVTKQIDAFISQARAEQQRAAFQARFRTANETVHMLNAQLALYRLQHNDQNPTLEQIGDGFAFLTTTTDAKGNPAHGSASYGPYMRRPVANPVTGKSKVVSAGQAEINAGWTYNPLRGTVKAVIPAQLEPQAKADLTPREAEYASTN
jgi:hypothetical protein